MRRKLLLFLIAASVVFLCRDRVKPIPADAEAEILEERKYIALTFDDGPKRSTTETLLNGLKKRGASVTFFLIGKQIEDNRDLVLRMAEEGHQVGNHTWSHQRLDHMNEGTIAQEVGQTERALEALLGPGDYWLRPPYGQVSAAAEGQISVPMVKWSVDPRDWESRNTDQVVQAILKDAKPNSIILLHDIYPTSVEAALQVVDSLQAQGYWFVTVEELLELNGVTPQPGTMYRRGTG